MIARILLRQAKEPKNLTTLVAMKKTKLTFEFNENSKDTKERLMKQGHFKPFCGFPHGFHEFASWPDMPEDDCCIHCGRPRHEIEHPAPPEMANKGTTVDELFCDCPEWDQEFIPEYPGVCIRCGTPVRN